jgi:hypothetical protein
VVELSDDQDDEAADAEGNGVAAESRAPHGGHDGEHQGGLSLGALVGRFLARVDAEGVEADGRGAYDPTWHAANAHLIEDVD